MYGKRVEWGLTRPDQAVLDERSRRQRWAVKTKARVTHPDHGSVVVPHSSNFAALLNAAEVWGCDWLEIRDATVCYTDLEDPVEHMPYII